MLLNFRKSDDRGRPERDGAGYEYQRFWGAIASRVESCRDRDVGGKVRPLDDRPLLPTLIAGESHRYKWWRPTMKPAGGS